MGQDYCDRLKQAVKKQAAKVDYFAYVENISPQIAVHEVRKAYKRIRALLKFIPSTGAGFPGDDAALIKAFGKELSGFREAGVQLQILDRIIVENPPVPEKKLRHIREKMAQKSAVLLEEIAAKKLGRNIRAHMKEFEERLNQFNMELSNNHFYDSHNRVYSESLLIYAEPALYENSERLHELRKKLKELYYQSGFLVVVNARFFKTKSNQLHYITEGLGNDHDYHIFLSEIGSDEYGLTYDELQIVENKVNHLRELNMRKCQLRLKKFFADSPDVFSQKLAAAFDV